MDGHLLIHRSVGQLARLVERLIAQTTAASSSPPDRTELAALPQADYNRVSETQLKQVKRKMDVVFEQNIVRPGEAGYEYDKQVAFANATEASDWDDE